MNRSLQFVLIAIAVVAAGCTSADTSDPTPRGSDTPTPPGSHVGSHPPPPNYPELAYVATDYALSGPKTTTAAITKVVLQNDGPNLHHLVVARIEEGHTADEAREALSTPAPAPSWIVFVGGPNAVEAGESQAAYVDLKEGTYILFCVIPDADFVPHVAHGMSRMLIVGPAVGAPPPAPVAVMRVQMGDFSYAGPSIFPAGEIVVEFGNGGPMEHEAVLVRLEGDTTAEEFLAVLAPDGSGERPGSFEGGVSPLAKGERGWAILDLEPGRYFWLCFVLADDGAPHFVHGMTQEFSVA